MRENEDSDTEESDSDIPQEEIDDQESDDDILKESFSFDELKAAQGLLLLQVLVPAEVSRPLFPPPSLPVTFWGSKRKRSVHIDNDEINPTVSPPPPLLLHIPNLPTRNTVSDTKPESSTSSNTSSNKKMRLLVEQEKEISIPNTTQCVEPGLDNWRDSTPLQARVEEVAEDNNNKGKAEKHVFDFDLNLLPDFDLNLLPEE